MAKNKGEKYECKDCGLVVLVEEPFGCESCELVCCDKPMKPAKTAKPKTKTSKVKK